MKKLIFAMAVAAAGAVSAGVSFSYQGALKTVKGENLPAEERNKTIEFRLYDNPTDAEALWGRALAVHLDEDGLFNVELSDTAGSSLTGVKTNDLAAVLSDYPGKDRSLYIGLTVLGSTGEIRPRQRLLHVPTAAFAADVSTAKNGFTVVKGQATFNNKVEAKGGMTVSGDKLEAKNGLTISGGGLTIPSGGLTISGGALTIGSGVLIKRSDDTAKGIIPRGVIVMWSGSAIPTGWHLCNGDEGTPDLQDRFVIGAGHDYAAGAMGGAKEVALSLSEIPPHSHSLGYDTQVCDNDDDDHAFNGTKDLGGGSGRATTTSAGGENGKTKAHNNMPPYYALCFIMKL